MPAKHPLYIEEEVLRLLKEGDNKTTAASKVGVSDCYASLVYHKFIDEMPRKDKAYPLRGKLEAMARKKNFDLEALAAREDIPLNHLKMEVKNTAYPDMYMRLLMQEMQLNRQERLALLDAAFEQNNLSSDSGRQKFFIGLSAHYAEVLTELY